MREASFEATASLSGSGLPSERDYGRGTILVPGVLRQMVEGRGPPALGCLGQLHSLTGCVAQAAPRRAPFDCLVRGCLARIRRVGRLRVDLFCEFPVVSFARLPMLVYLSN